MERGTSLIVGPLCFLVGGIYGTIVTDLDKPSVNKPQIERQVQLQNEHLNQQLSQGGRFVTRLVLNTDTNTFSFDSTNQNDQAEVCRGTYNIGKDNSTATAIGKLACTIDIPINR